MLASKVLLDTTALTARKDHSPNIREQDLGMGMGSTRKQLDMSCKSQPNLLSENFIAIEALLDSHMKQQSKRNYVEVVANR